MMTDGNTHVKDITAWMLGHMSDLLVMTIKTDVHLHPLIAALVTGLGDSLRIIANCCCVLKNLVEQLGGSYYDEDGNESQNEPLSPYYGQTALHPAIASIKQLDYIQALLKHPAININLSNAESHWTPLHRVLYNANISTA
jgi:hypothetical protein